MSSKTRVRIEYADHNESFARLLPVLGTIVARFSDVVDDGAWFLVHLNEPIQYQLSESESSEFRLASFSAFLIRSRWVEQRVGDPGEIQVFIRVVEEGEHPDGDSINPDDFIHIAWGKCIVVENG